MSYHRYRINEVYSDASGTIQFVELAVGAFNGESFWAGVTLSSTRAGVTHRYTFPNNLPSQVTADTTVLVATQGFADLGIVVPDFIVPAGFLFVAGGSLDFGGVDAITYPVLPADGVHSVDRGGVVGVASPKNFAGATDGLPTGPATISGTPGNDTLSGTAASETIAGLDGDDTLRSGGGNDTLRGGAGDDTLYSGPGNDTLDGGDGYDTLSYAEAAGAVTINLQLATASGGAGSDTLTGFEVVVGSRFDDTFVGSDGINLFFGGEGNDTATGGAGRDRFEGGPGNDTLDGQGSLDQVSYQGAPSAVTVNLTSGSAGGGHGSDLLHSIEDVIGSAFGDTLTGNQSLNTLEGGDGNDTLFSTNGDDILLGGNGIDTVVFPMQRSAYTLHPRLGVSNQFFTVEKPNSFGVDSLAGVERLLFFNDERLAFDLLPGGHANQVARLLGAVFGRDAVADKAYVGIGLALRDGGVGYEALAAAAVAAAGVSAPADVVALIYSRLVGSAPTPAQAAPFVELLTSGAISVGALTVIAADLDLNATNIGLVGLMETGLAYLLPG